MVGPDLPEIPQGFKSLQQYLKLASTHDERDPVVSYWCRLYALELSMSISNKTTSEVKFLMQLMDWVEAAKEKLRANEAITNSVAAQAHLENWALKLFQFADKNDRASNFGKNVIQSFFTAGLLYDVITIFGELSEEAAQNRKYAKWKATYIYNCLKNGETPVPGPMQDDSGTNMDEGRENMDSEATKSKGESTVNSGDLADMHDIDSLDVPHGTPSKGKLGERSSEKKGDNNDTVSKTEDGTDLLLKQMNKAQKFITWAGSALNYDDVPTAVLNLRKALQILTTDEENV